MNLPDLLLIDKPAGITSFDVIRRLRRQLNIKKMGHAGTLDPAATGLLLIGVGPGTKQLNDFIKLDKEYIAEILVGTKTDSGDMDGRILKEVAVLPIEESIIEKTVASMVGTYTLPVSAFSAIKKDGVPYYKRAHKAAKEGKEVTDTPMREMTIYESDYLGSVVDGDKLVITVRFLVESGTYIRSLGEEIGKKLGYPATLQNLRRTKIGIFDVMHAKQIEEVTQIEISSPS